MTAASLYKLHLSISRNSSQAKTVWIIVKIKCGIGFFSLSFDCERTAQLCSHKEQGALVTSYKQYFSFSFFDSLEGLRSSQRPPKTRRSSLSKTSRHFIILSSAGRDVSARGPGERGPAGAAATNTLLWQVNSSHSPGDDEATASRRRRSGAELVVFLRQSLSDDWVGQRWLVKNTKNVRKVHNPSPDTNTHTQTHKNR